MIRSGVVVFGFLPVGTEMMRIDLFADLFFVASYNSLLVMFVLVSVSGKGIKNLFQTDGFII